MSDSPSVSLVIVSRKRPKSLRRTVSSLRFQSYQNFEVIVVSDVQSADFLPHADKITHIHFDEANISAARNIGINAARGDIVAFCDDDAVPDPMWLERLVAPFAVPTVASAGGFVRARNGIEFQWRALLSDRFGNDHSFDVDEHEYKVVPFDGERFAKLQGTNCAFLRSALIEIGGFDTGFHFYLDETDVCLRLAQLGYDSAFVPLAQVHHGFAESDQRGQDRAPKTLFEIGASQRRFLDKHATETDLGPHWKNLRDVQKVRLIGLMVDGRIEPRDIDRLLATLHTGFETVRDARTAQNVSVDGSFKKFGHEIQQPARIFAGSTLSRRKLMDKVTNATDFSAPTLVLMFSITSLFHKRDYDERGFWMQTGGMFGKSNRNDPVFRFQSLHDRIKSEYERVSEIFPKAELRTIKFLRDFVLEKTKSNVK